MTDITICKVVSFLGAVKRPLHILVEFLQKSGHFTVHWLQYIRFTHYCSCLWLFFIDERKCKASDLQTG